MKKSFGTLPSGEETFLYTISCGKLSAAVTDYGATLVSLLVPDRDGVLADVVLGYDDCEGYRTGNGACLGATVGRNANRLKGASFDLNGKTYLYDRGSKKTVLCPQNVLERIFGNIVVED